MKLDWEWQAADELARRALVLDSSNAQAKSLRALALDRKREQFVDNSVAQARRLQGDGDLEGALQLVEQGLAEFPRDTRLTQLRATLRKAVADAAEVRATLGGMSPPSEAAHAAGAAVATETVLIPAAPPTPAASAAAAVPAPVAAPAPEPVSTQTIELAPRPPLQTPPVAVPTQTNGSAAPPPAQPPRTGPPRKPPLLAIAASMGAVLLLLFGGGAVMSRWKKAPVPVPASAPPVVQAPAPVVEQPVNTTLRVFADLEGGKYTLDDRDPADLQDGQISLDNLPPGEHTLKIRGSREEANIVFHTAQGAAPGIDSLSAKELLAVTVTSMGDKAKVQSSSPSAEVGLDGKPAGEAGAGGLDLTGLSQGDHELTIGEGKDLRSMVLGIGAPPCSPRSSSPTAMSARWSSSPARTALKCSSTASRIAGRRSAARCAYPTST